MIISISAVVWIIVYLILGGIVFGLLNLLIDRAPFIPAEWKPALKWILLLLGILFLIGVVLSVMGGGPIFRP